MEDTIVATASQRHALVVGESSTPLPLPPPPVPDMLVPLDDASKPLDMVLFVGGHTSWPPSDNDAELTPLTLAKDIDTIGRFRERCKQAQTPQAAVAIMDTSGEPVNDVVDGEAELALEAVGPAPASPSGDAKLIGGGLLDKHAKTLSEFVRRFARDRGDLPKTVKHDRPCVGLCKYTAERTIWYCYLQLKNQITATVKTHVTTRKLKLEDLTLCVGIRSDWPDGTTDWAFGIIHATLGAGTVDVGQVTESVAVLTPVSENSGTMRTPVGEIIAFRYIVTPEPKNASRFLEGVEEDDYEYIDTTTTPHFIRRIFRDARHAVKQVSLLCLNFEWHNQKWDHLVITNVMWDFVVKTDLAMNPPPPDDDSDDDVDWGAPLKRQKKTPTVRRPPDEGKSEWTDDDLTDDLEELLPSPKPRPKPKSPPRPPSHPWVDEASDIEVNPKPKEPNTPPSPSSSSSSSSSSTSSSNYDEALDDDNDPSTRQTRKIPFGLPGQAIAPVYKTLPDKTKVQIGWGATCGRHRNRTDKTCCKKQMPFGNLSDAECRCRIKMWLIEGLTEVASCSPTARNDHLKINPRKLKLVPEAELDAMNFDTS